MEEAHKRALGLLKIVGDVHRTQLRVLGMLKVPDGRVV